MRLTQELREVQTSGAIIKDKSLIVNLSNKLANTLGLEFLEL